MDINYLPLTDMRIARTFCFTDGGQALYLSSPTEIQRITYSQEMCDNLQVRAPARRPFHLTALVALDWSCPPMRVGLISRLDDGAVN